MLLHCILFCFCFATSIGFHFDDITANATAYTPFALTWHLDQGEDPDELHLKQRSITQNSGDGQPIDFSFPDNGTHSGTVSVNFTAPGLLLQRRLRVSTSIALSSTVTSNASAAVYVFLSFRIYVDVVQCVWV
ncbi:hypothetical protein EDD18DRAFT_1224206 [Armillaria luteobubalina]|uniref:Uncharacterized protein n=1 Tax=Armillaria luteobubalina TaxID=153913 RepID=A0AA39NXP7_9AGAR|nr:hypothetical protein EDD18DRAFT_1224206 [Armillaria luteobubalina]